MSYRFSFDADDLKINDLLPARARVAIGHVAHDVRSDAFSSVDELSESDVYLVEEDLDEEGVSGPVSDDDIMISFERMDDALNVREMALLLGLNESEVMFSSTTKLQQGNYALFIAGYVPYYKPEVLESLFALIRDGIEEQAVIDEILMLPMLNEVNPYHAAPDPTATVGSTEYRGGQFTNKPALKKAAKGSYSAEPKPKMRVAGKAKKGLKLRVTSRYCGRRGRAMGKHILCYTGKAIDPETLRKLRNLRRKARRAAKKKKKVESYMPGSVGAMMESSIGSGPDVDVIVVATGEGVQPKRFAITFEPYRDKSFVARSVGGSVGSLINHVGAKSSILYINKSGDVVCDTGQVVGTVKSDVVRKFSKMGK